MLLKITPSATTPDHTCLFLEGRLGAPSVGEVAASSEAALARGGAVVLDLGGLLYLDDAGAAALRELRARGCVLVGGSGFVAEMIGDTRETAPPPSAPGADVKDERDFVARLRAGHEDAFEQLVRSQTGPLLAAARRVLRNEDDARDAVQETFTSAFRHLDGFAGDAKLSTWLHRIVINAALMKLRSRSRRPEEPIDDLLPTFDETGHWASGLPQRTSEAEERLDAQETRALVQRCIDRLPPTLRTVLVLRDLEDLDTTEVADSLGVTPNAVKIRLHRARQALRTLIERERAACEV